MQCDHELIKKILLAVEAKKNLIPDEITIDGYDETTVAYHCLLLNDAGFIEASFEETLNGNVTPFVRRMTWSGVEFLQAARNDTIWEKAKKVLKDKSVSVPISLLTDLLRSLLKETLSLK
jgi:hypothetical protein